MKVTILAGENWVGAIIYKVVSQLHLLVSLWMKLICSWKVATAPVLNLQTTYYLAAIITALKMYSCTLKENAGEFSLYMHGSTVDFFLTQITPLHCNNWSLWSMTPQHAQETAPLLLLSEFLLCSRVLDCLQLYVPGAGVLLKGSDITCHAWLYVGTQASIQQILRHILSMWVIPWKQTGFLMVQWTKLIENRREMLRGHLVSPITPRLDGDPTGSLSNLFLQLTIHVSKYLQDHGFTL